MSASIAPLTKCKPDGEPYRRMAAVEERLGQLIDLPWDEIVRLAAIGNRAHPDYVPSECLLHLLRSTRHDNHDGRFNRLFAFLMKRFLRALPGKDQQGSERIVIDAQLNDIRDWARDRFHLLITADRDGGDRLDFYEVHFDGAVAKLRLSARAAVGRGAKRETPIERDPETQELSPAIEAAAARDRGSDEQFLLDEHFRPRLLAAIDRLPPEQREVVTMILNNIQTEAKDPNTPSIAGLLGCDQRTVQYRRGRAIKALRAMLGLGGGE